MGRQYRKEHRNMNKDSWVEVIPATKNAMASKQGFKKMRVAAYCRVSTDSEE